MGDGTTGPRCVRVSTPNVGPCPPPADRVAASRCSRSSSRRCASVHPGPRLRLRLPGWDRSSAAWPLLEAGGLRPSARRRRPSTPPVPAAASRRSRRSRSIGRRRRPGSVTGRRPAHGQRHHARPSSGATTCGCQRSVSTGRSRSSHARARLIPETASIDGAAPGRTTSTCSGMHMGCSDPSTTRMWEVASAGA